MKEKIRLEWLGTVGGLLALLSFFLPFEPDRSLFAILENTPLPFFSPSLGWMGPGAPLMTLGLLVMLFSPYAA